MRDLSDVNLLCDHMRSHVLSHSYLVGTYLSTVHSVGVAVHVMCSDRYRTYALCASASSCARSRELGIRHRVALGGFLRCHVWSPGFPTRVNQSHVVIIRGGMVIFELVTTRNFLCQVSLYGDSDE